MGKIADEIAGAFRRKYAAGRASAKEEDASFHWFEAREEAIAPFRQKYGVPDSFEIRPGLPPDFPELERCTSILLAIGDDAPAEEREDADYETVRILGYYQRAKEPIPGPLFRLVARRLNNHNYAIRRKRLPFWNRVASYALAHPDAKPAELARRFRTNRGTIDKILSGTRTRRGTVVTRRGRNGG